MAKIVYCHCAFAEVVRKDVKDEVLRGLAESGQSFETVPDLCEMAARKDPKLGALLEDGPVKIAACYPRAVKWLFESAGVKFPEDEESVTVLNMREDPVENVLDELLEDEE